LSFSGSWPDFTHLDEAPPGIGGFGFGFNLFVANVMLVVFNLIPAFPMDGGRMLRAILSFNLPRNKATQIAAGIGQTLAIAFVFLGFFVNIWLVFIGIFIYLGAGAEAHYENTKSILSGHIVRDVLMEQFSPLSPGQSLASVVELLLDGQETEFVVLENGEVSGIVNRNDLIKGLADHGKEATVAQVSCSDFLALEPTADLMEAFQQLKLNSCSVAPVIQDGRLLGIVDQENVNEFIMVNQALERQEKHHI